MPPSIPEGVSRHFHARPFRALIESVTLVLALLAASLSPLAQVAGSIEVYPARSSIETGSTRQFSAYVPISPNTITWLVNDIPGGNATIGTISASGLYTAPAAAPAANVVTVKARSIPYPASAGSATLTITRPYPWLWSVSPSKLTVGNYEVSFNGANFAPDSQALANGMPVATTYLSPTRLVARGSTTAAGTIAFSVRQPGNGSVTGNAVSATVATATIAVSVAPASASVALGATRTFSATVTGTANTAVTWSVNGMPGGTPTVGTISPAGIYTAPATLPSPATVTVTAAASASPGVTGSASITLVQPPPAVTVALSPSAATVALNQSRTFTATVSGSANTAVTWTVNGATGGNATVGTISAGGVYTAPNALPNPPSVTVRATSVANPASFAQATVTVSAAPPPPVTATWLTGARFLEQASFGPSPASLARIQSLGIQAYLAEQFALPETPIPTPSDNSMGTLQQWVLYTQCSAPDQLRQRVAYALGQILVTSRNKLIYPDEILPWMRLLSKHAFGNYRTLLREMTLSPSMGKYLDLANSMKPGLAGGANENYPRELMQLFTIGLWELNPDGSQRLDGLGQPIPSYNQQTVSQVARALTGWTYATAPGATPRANNWEYFGAPMEPRPANHDTGAKSFLNVTLPANQSVDQDLDSVIDSLMNHPNIAPFIVTRLIRFLVTSNPSPGFIQRMAGVFNNNGAGVRGDLQAVVGAILLDPEARDDAASPNQGRLKEPMLQIAGFLRSLNGGFAPTQGLVYLYDYMAQGVLNPPSVFSWYSPLYRIPKSPLFGPEFQIYSPTEASLRGNFLYTAINHPAGDLQVDLSPFQPYGNDMPALVEKVNQTLLYGRMPAAMKTILINAATPGYDAKTRIETVLYLTALSGQYAVQY